MDACEAQQVLDGSMLGDAGLYLGVRSINAYLHMSLSHGSKHLDLLNVVKESLTSLGVSVSPRYPHLGSGYSKGKYYIYVVLNSRTSELLTRQQTRWYVGGRKGIKVVPDDLCLTPISLAHWYMDDGSIREIQPGYVEIRLSTQCFSEDDVSELIRQLDELGVRRAYYYMEKSGPVIDVSTVEGVNAFLDLVEPCIVPSFEHLILRPHRAKFRVIHNKFGGIRLNRRIPCQ